MSVGLYSAIGRVPDAARDEITRVLGAFSAAIDRGDDVATALPERARAAGLAAVAAIRSFEARVGERCGAVVEIVATPKGRAIEIGNRGHRGFGQEYEPAAAEVARALAALLTALGATGVFSITLD